MRVLIIGWLPPELGGKHVSGPSFFTMRLARKLRDLNVEVAVVDSTRYRNFTPKRSNNNTKGAFTLFRWSPLSVLPSVVRTFFSLPVITIKIALRLRNCGFTWRHSVPRISFFLSCIKSWDPDIVHVQGGGVGALITTKLCQHLQKPFLVTLHGFWKKEDRVDKRVYDTQLTLLKETGPTISFFSSRDFREARACLADPSRSRIILSAFDDSQFEIMDKALARQELGLPKEAFILLTVGSIQERKNQESVIRAVALLKDLRRSLYERTLYVLVGSGVKAYEEKLKRTSRALGVEERVIFAGRQFGERLARHYNAADFLILMSFMEGLAAVILETLACGTPVVACEDLGGADDVLSSSNSVMAKSHEIEDIAYAISEAFSKKGCFERMRLRETVEKFAWSNQARQYLELYEDLINGPYCE